MKNATYKEILTAIHVLVLENWNSTDTQAEVTALISTALRKTNVLEDLSALWSLRWCCDAKWGVVEYKADCNDLLTELRCDEETHMDLDQSPSVGVVHEEEPKVFEPNPDDFSKYGDKKVALAVGHNKFTGARSHKGDDEWTTRNEVTTRAAKILQERGITTKVFYRKKSLSYGSAMRQHGKDINSFGATLAVEVHFNSATPSAHGMEMLVVSKESGKVFEPFIKKFHEHYPDVTVRHNNGIKLLSSGGRGGGFCRAPKCPTGVWEPFFASNVSEYDKFDDKYDKEALALADAIVASLD